MAAETHKPTFTAIYCLPNSGRLFICLFETLAATHLAPWEPEHLLLASGLPLPLNIDGNPCTAFIAPLSALRSAAKRRAETLPLIADSSGPRRARDSLA